MKNKDICVMLFIRDEWVADKEIPKDGKHLRLDIKGDSDFPHEMVDAALEEFKIVMREMHDDILEQNNPIFKSGLRELIHSFCG